MNKHLPKETADKFILDPAITSGKFFNRKVGTVTVSEITPEVAQQYVDKGCNFIKPINEKGTDVVATETEKKPVKKTEEK